MARKKLTVWVLLCTFLFIRATSQTNSTNASMPDTLAKQSSKSKSQLRNKAEVVYGVIRRLNWTSITVFTHSVTEEWRNLFKILTNGSSFRIRIVSKLDTGSFQYHNSGRIFTDESDRLYIITCTLECVHKILDLITRIATERFLFSSKWLIVTNKMLPNATAKQFENMAYILSNAMATLKIDGDTRTLSRVQDINKCENKDYTDRMYRERLFPNLYNGLSGRTVRIGIEQWHPYIIKEHSTNGTIKYVGLGIDVIEALEKVLNFRAKYFEYPDKAVVWQTSENG